MSSGGGQVRPDGSFTVSNVAPGDYTLRAISGSGGLLSGANELVEAKVMVAGEDLDNLRLMGIKASSATGSVVLPPGITGLSLTSLQLMALPSTPELLNPASTARVSDDGSFELKVQPGSQLVRMNPIGAFANLRIKAVRLNGVDVTDSGIEFRPNEDVTGLEVELTNQVTDLSGYVTNARGENVKDYSVVVFSRDRERWGFASRFLGGGRPDQDGKFRVRNLPAGNYYAIALDYVEQGAGTDPEFLDRVKDRATEFSLNDAETKTLSLKLVTGL
jgi:hypothetical protein